MSGTHAIFLTGNYIEPATSYDDEDDEDEDEMGYDLEPDEDEIDVDEELDELDELADVGHRVVEVEDEDEVPALIEAVTKTSKKSAADAKKGKNKRSMEADEVMENGENLDELITKAKNDAPDTKLSKKQLKKLKKNDGTAAVVEPDVKEPASSAKKVAFAKNIEQGPTPSKPVEGDSSKGSLGTKTVQGVTLDDRKIGTGPGAKSGDRLGMRYIGKLKDGKVFDSNRKGKPFSFKLGSGETIKGWDVGIQGMSVGGERRLTIPAHLAYGSKGNGDIPPNSTLTFDLKLIEINKGK